jgi:hypothetical protein
MKNTIKRITTAFAATLAIATSTNSVLADTIVPGRCNQGKCWENRIERKTLIRRTNSGDLYSIVTSQREWDFGAESTKTEFGTPKVNYAFCSTKSPAVIFEVDRQYYAHLLNPGADDFYGYNMSDYPVYWAVCHNIVGTGNLMDYFTGGIITEQAIKLGYPLNLPSDQIELANPLAITYLR